MSDAKTTAIVGRSRFCRGLVCGSVDVYAAWPSGAGRTLPGEFGLAYNTRRMTCTACGSFVDSSTSYCAFVSDWNPDAASMWGGWAAYARGIHALRTAQWHQAVLAVKGSPQRFIRLSSTSSTPTT